MGGINDVFLETKNDFTSVTKRLGLICFRLVMILTVLRNKEAIQEEPLIMKVSNVDLNTALGLTYYLTDHSLHVFDKYEKKIVKMTVQERQLYTELPEEFKSITGAKIAKEIKPLNLFSYFIFCLANPALIVLAIPSLF